MKKSASAMAMLGLISLFSISTSQADLVLNVVGVSVVEDFDDFRGDGFSSSPTATQLDSNTYRAAGFSDGDGVFGGNHVTGDFSRGESTGAIVTGGAYAFDVGGGDYGVGVQPTSSDFNPGTFTIRVINMTGVAIDGVDISGDGYFYNDGDRATRWIFEISFDDTIYIPFQVLDSPETADEVPAWRPILFLERCHFIQLR